MQKFAFVIHPISVRRDMARKYPVAQYLPEALIAAMLPHLSPKVVSHITGIQSDQPDTTAEGWFIVCPLTPKQLLTLPTEVVYKKLIECGRIAQDLGAGIMGLGALTSVVGDGGITISRSLDIAVTTGNSYTVATAVEGAIRGAELMGTPMEEATVAVVGAAGSIGRTCALLLAPEARRIVLIGRNRERLEPVAREIRTVSGHAEVAVTDDITKGLKDADVVVTVTSAADAVILPEHLKKGAVVCDVARPRDVSTRVARERNDVLIIEGGLVSVPGPHLDFGFDFGFPPQTAYACMSETMLLALEAAETGRYESFTLGKEVSPVQAQTMQRLAKKHGFRLGGFRSFEKAVGEEDIAAVRRAAGRVK
ncbi:MAG: shikimate dehydrogenase [Cytophagales bacterium]|nr:shikimate dehydrogenase [Armatimonadota bacterium]